MFLHVLAEHRPLTWFFCLVLLSVTEGFASVFSNILNLHVLEILDLALVPRFTTVMPECMRLGGAEAYVPSQAI